MRFTRYTDYSFRVLMYLGVKPADELSTIKEIADRYGISENHLMKVVHQLGRHGFVTTVRGRQGGLALARAPVEINLGDVVRRCEEDLDLVECFNEETNRCAISPVCAFAGVVGEALEAFLAVFDGYTLADILAPRDGLISLLSPT
ncbi:MAG: Rrf2 family transcriptional regulator [Alphaproteobacteria bacterium]|nr:Rrf2 family transcriptional regulator [Alphaproteobacteria bacterium]